MKLISGFSISLLCITSMFAGTISQVTDNSQLTDSASWSGLGAEADSTPVATGATVTSTNGVVVTPAPTAGGSLYRLDEGSGWNGGFPNGDPLLYYDGPGFASVGGDITLSFSQLVSGAGLLIQDDLYDDTDTVTISAYDSLDNLLGTETTAYNGNNIPVFIGLLDTDQEIASVTIGTNEGPFAVDTLNLADTAATPEPANLILAGLALLSFGAIRRFRPLSVSSK